MRQLHVAFWGLWADIQRSHGQTHRTASLSRHCGYIDWMHTDGTALSPVTPWWREHNCRDVPSGAENGFRGNGVAVLPRSVLSA